MPYFCENIHPVFMLSFYRTLLFLFVITKPSPIIDIYVLVLQPLVISRTKLKARSSVTLNYSSIMDGENIKQSVRTLY